MGDFDSVYTACGKQLVGFVRKDNTPKKLIAADTNKSLTGPETSAIEKAVKEAKACSEKEKITIKYGSY